MVNSEELIGTTGHVTLYTECRYNRVRLFAWRAEEYTRSFSEYIQPSF
jgi:hypothetical protein